MVSTILAREVRYISFRIAFVHSSIAIHHKGFEDGSFEEALEEIKEHSFEYSDLPLHINLRYKEFSEKSNALLDEIVSKHLGHQNIVMFPPMENDKMSLLKDLKGKYIIHKSVEELPVVEEEKVNTSVKKENGSVHVLSQQPTPVKKSIDAPPQTINIAKLHSNHFLNPLYFWKKGVQVCEDSTISSVSTLINKTYFDYYGSLGYMHQLTPLQYTSYKIQFIGITYPPIPQKEIPLEIKIKYSILAPNNQYLSEIEWHTKELTITGINVSLNLEIEIDPPIITYETMLFKLQKENGEDVCTSIIPLHEARHGLRWVPVYDNNGNKLAFTKLIANFKYKS